MKYPEKYRSFTLSALVLGSALLYSSGMAAAVEDPAAVPATQAEAASAREQPSLDGAALNGTVLETMNASGYTYLLLETGQQGKVWVAVPETRLKAGEAVSCSPGITMKDFESKTLKRRFATIVFSPGLTRADGKAAENGSSPSRQRTEADFAEALRAEQAKSEPLLVAGESSGSKGAVAPRADINVNKASGPDSYSVAECFAQAKELNGKTIRVRGKIMKISRMIMGKNWLHIQDGTGDPLENHHDLVVTTTNAPEEGSVVTVEGVLSAGRDFGAGYAYEAIIEDAKVDK